MAADHTEIIGGPCEALVDAATVGHTAGGCSMTYTPQQREVVVDQFGSSPVNYRHTGHEVRATVPFAEWTATTIGLLYAGSVTLTDEMGVGRPAGSLLPDVDLKLVPFTAADVGKYVHVPRAVPIGAMTISYSNDQDTIFEQEYAGLIDPSLTAGQQMFTVGVDTGA